ncbi:hypothetical protein PAMP_021475 [Pampus punctatissimus]
MLNTEADPVQLLCASCVIKVVLERRAGREEGKGEEGGLSGLEIRSEEGGVVAVEAGS